MAGHIVQSTQITMNEQQIAIFKQCLLEKREQLLAFAKTGDEAAQTVELDQSKVGRLSRMDALQQQAMSMESNRRREIELQKIASALQRIKDGEYGYCVSCGDEIHEKRLHIDPAAPQCVDCAEKTHQ